MTITRIDAEHRMSEAVVHDQTVYYTSVPENLDDDAEAQTANALAVIDRILTRVGSDKSKNSRRHHFPGRQKRTLPR